jgi:hypothetical protein
VSRERGNGRVTAEYPAGLFNTAQLALVPPIPEKKDSAAPGAGGMGGMY